MFSLCTTTSFLLENPQYLICWASWATHTYTPHGSGRTNILLSCRKNINKQNWIYLGMFWPTRCSVNLEVKWKVPNLVVAQQPSLFFTLLTTSGSSRGCSGCKTEIGSEGITTHSTVLPLFVNRCFPSFPSSVRLSIHSATRDVKQFIQLWNCSCFSNSWFQGEFECCRISSAPTYEIWEARVLNKAPQRIQFSLMTILFITKNNKVLSTRFTLNTELLRNMIFAF